MIRDHPRFAQTAIIFVSAVHLSEFDSLRGYQAGAVDYLAGPDCSCSSAREGSHLLRPVQEDPATGDRSTKSWREGSKLARPNWRRQMRTWKREWTPERASARRRWRRSRRCRSSKASDSSPAGLAHDFNNLLMVVMSNLEMALNRVAGDDRLTRWLGRAMEAATRGASLTKRMLAFARRQDLKPESVAAFGCGQRAWLK